MATMIIGSFRKCKKCGIELEFYGEKKDMVGLWSINQENSYDYLLCNKCCNEKSKGVDINV